RFRHRNRTPDFGIVCLSEILRCGQIDFFEQLHQPNHRRLIEPQHDVGSLHQNRPLDQVGILRHQLQSLLARWWMVLHAALAVQLVPRIQKQLVVALSDQPVEFFDGQPLIQVDFLKIRALFAKPTLRFPASRSSGFQIKFHHSQFKSA
ncbi:MAG TPA: hypothetical protein VMH81_37095, partial [Bryobacteraceae bacterium]|nr:hypothetical protein [Bryobacteraceae bacterium]